MLKEHPKLGRLREFLGDGQRPVCFQINGPSIAELPKWLSMIPEDVVWVGHNFYWPTEHIIEEHLNHHLDLVYVSSLQMIQTCGDYYRRFLERPDNNLLLTSTQGETYFKIHQPGLLDKFENKVIITRCEPGVHLPEHAFDVVEFPGQVFSFALALLILLKAGVQIVVFFGLDGGLPEGYSNWVYGNVDDFPIGGQPNSYQSELDLINSQWSNMTAVAGLDQNQFQIFNCSPKSNVTCFEKIEYSSLDQIFSKVDR